MVSVVQVRSALLDQLKTAGCSKMFCGHFHSNVLGGDEDFELVTTGAVGCGIPLREGQERPLGPEGQDFSNGLAATPEVGIRPV